MKIAYLFEQYPSTSETFLAREVEALRKIGFEIEIYAIRAGEGAIPIEMPSRALKLLGKHRYWQQVGGALASKLRISNVLHVHATWANHIAELAQVTAQRAGVPWSFAAHARDLWVEGGNLKGKLASAQFAVTCTRAGEAHLKSFGANVLYAPHGVELSKYEWRPWDLPSGPYQVLGVGRLVEKKGWPYALKAVGMLNQRGFEARLVLIGQGPLMQELDGSKDLQLRGALPHTQVIEVMGECQCCILPSLRTPDGDRDGLANVLLEAAALGVPIVTTTSGSAGDFVNDSTGLLVEPGDSEALCEALEKTFREPEATSLRCRNARAKVEAEFEISNNVMPLARAFRKELPFSL